MFSYTLQFLGSTIYSILVEVMVVALLIRFVLKLKNIYWYNIVTAGTFATLATIPYVWYIFPILFYYSSTTGLLLGEIFAVVVETIVYTLWLRLPLDKAFMIVLLANLVSYYTGVIVEPWRLFMD
jgi:hypothetical protein